MEALPAKRDLAIYLRAMFEGVLRRLLDDSATAKPIYDGAIISGILIEKLWFFFSLSRDVT